MKNATEDGRMTFTASGAGRDLQETTFLLISQQCLPSQGKITETQNWSKGRLGVDEYNRSDGKGRAEEFRKPGSPTQLDSTSTMFYALKEISGLGLKITGNTVKVIKKNKKKKSDL